MLLPPQASSCFTIDDQFAIVPARSASAYFASHAAISAQARIYPECMCASCSEGQLTRWLLAQHARLRPLEARMSLSARPAEHNAPRLRAARTL